MNVSVFSCLTAICWFSLIVLLAAILRRRSNILTRLGLWPVTFLLIVGLLRLFFPVTLPATKVLHSTALLPVIQRILQRQAVFLPFTFDRANGLGRACISLRDCMGKYSKINNDLN